MPGGWGSAALLAGLASARLARAFHVTAAFFGVEFFAALSRHRGVRAGEPLRILEVGSLDVNGALRSYSPRHWHYVGVDVVPGPGVDHVLVDHYKYPFEDESFDAVVTTSALEHTQFFWLAFVEMLRVLRGGGNLLVIVPSNLRHHMPPDSWRFLGDAGSSLEAWGHRAGYGDLRLLQGFVHPPVPYQGHEDNIMLFEKARAGGAGGQALRLPEEVPSMLEATLDRVISHHWCWQPTSSAPRREVQRYALPPFPGRTFSLGFACCAASEMRLHGDPAATAVWPDPVDCWGPRANRSYDTCCPHVLTD